MEDFRIVIKCMGVIVHKLNAQDILAIIHDAVINNKRAIIANHNIHSVYLYHKDRKMASFYGISDFIFIDGMPLVWLGKLLGYQLTRENRMTSLDWLPPVLSQAAQEAWKIFYLGSKPGVAERGAEILKSKFPKLQIATCDGYFDANPQSAENRHVVEVINEYCPNILIVGMGMPRQEHWVFDNFKQVHSNVTITIGAYVDYIAGEIPTPPRWMGRIGLEWLYRLGSEPRRLWRRYLVEPLFLLGIVVRDIIAGLGGKTR